MFNSILFKCPYLKVGNDGARCDAVSDLDENNLIKNMADVDIKLCVNNKRRFEVCSFYFEHLRRRANTNQPIDITSFESPPFIFSGRKSFSCL